MFETEARVYLSLPGSRLRDRQGGVWGPRRHCPGVRRCSPWRPTPGRWRGADIWTFLELFVFWGVFKYQTEKCLGLKRLAMENLLVNIESNRPKRQDKFLLCKPVISDSCSLQIRITCVLTNRLKGYRYEGLYNLKFCYKKDRFC